MDTSPRLAFTRTNASVLLDLIRGLAALLVCMEHWRNLLFVDFNQLHANKALLSVFYVVTSVGHEAVMIFFVMSGYLISGSIFRLVESGKWSWRLYLTHRLVRLWIVLLPALVLGAILDNVGLRLYLNPALYAGLTGTHMLGNVADTLHPHIFFGNVFFLQTIFVPSFGSNSPLWSLANEFWYYILFPCAYLIFLRKTSWKARVLNGLVLIACAVLVGKSILLLFPVWLLGAALARIKPPRVGIKLRVIAACLYCPLFFLLGRAPFMHGLLFDYILGTVSFLFIWLLLGSRGASPESWQVKLARKAAQFSYTLYLVHVPFLVLLISVLVRDAKWYPDAHHLLIAFAVLLVTIGYAYAVASVSEFRTAGIRAWVEEKVLDVRWRVALSTRKNIPVAAGETES